MAGRIVCRRIDDGHDIFLIFSHVQDISFKGSPVELGILVKKLVSAQLPVIVFADCLVCAPVPVGRQDFIAGDV